MRPIVWLLPLCAALACSGPDALEGSVLAEVATLKRDRETNVPIVVLRETSGEREISIWIGEAEAH